MSRCLTLIYNSTASQQQGSLHTWEPRDGSAAVSSPEQSAPGSGLTQPPPAATAGLAGADKALQRESEVLASSASGSAPASDSDSYLPQSVREAWRSMHEGGAAAGLTQAQAITVAAGAAVLLYAGMQSSPVSSSFSHHISLWCTDKW